jgi:hypothetical protein
MEKELRTAMPQLRAAPVISALRIQALCVHATHNQGNVSTPDGEVNRDNHIVVLNIPVKYSSLFIG